MPSRSIRLLYSLLTPNYPEPGSHRPDRRLLCAWLLLFVASEPDHGYGLQRRCEEHGLSTDQSGLYRALRKLEANGSLASSWREPDQGPQRRVYRLTDAGRRDLAQTAAAITTARAHHDAFLRACSYRTAGESLGGGGAPPASPRRPRVRWHDALDHRGLEVVDEPRDRGDRGAVARLIENRQAPNMRGK
jgi:PadR family transcriptional regulator PadR